MPKISQLVYTSTLSPSTLISEVSAIIRSSRSRNLNFGITGVLLFDGHHFCQSIEGEPYQVSVLIANIRNDCRNTDFKVIYLETTEGMRKFSNWRAGYPMECAPEVMEKVICARPDVLLDSFMQMTASYDLV